MSLTNTFFKLSKIDRIKAELFYYKALVANPSTPRISKWLLIAATAYLLSPIDLIPDFIPFIGQLDDLIIVPLLIYLALTLIPLETKAFVRNEQRGT